MLSTGRGRNDCKKALCAATKYMVVVAIVVALVSGILYLILGQSDIPVKDFEVRREAANHWLCRGAFSLCAFVLL